MGLYQPKATTLTCVLVRMVALELILEYPPLFNTPFPLLSYKYKATNIYKYLTPYACVASPISTHTS